MTEHIRFHFLDVGDGDCTLIEFPSGRIGVVDIHTDSEKNSNWDKVIPYMKKIIGDKGIFRFILTHPHQDHLHGFKDLVEAFPIENFWHTKHEFEPEKNKDKKRWTEYEPHWNAYTKLGDKRLIFTREHCNNDFLTQDNIKIISPSKDLEDSMEEIEDERNRVHRNNYVLKINHGDFSALLCGDADCPALTKIVEVDANEIKDIILLKAPHHGTEGHWNEDFVKLCNPKISILFQGNERHENSFEEEYAKYSKIGNTFKHGVIVIDGFKNGSYKVVSNGTYDKVLTDLGLEKI